MTDPALRIVDRATATADLVTLTVGLAAAALLFVPLEHFWPARRAGRLPRGTGLNLTYWFFTPLFTKVVTNAALAGILVGVFAALGRPIDESILDGFGPLARQPLWLQTLEILLVADFADYWTHRVFHTSRAWRFHAVHHSPEEMTWLSAGRMHPVNDLVTRVVQVAPVALLGFAAKGVVLVVPALVAYVILLHANVKWDFGPLRYVLVSPAYHRWHHTSDAEGLDKNFAGIFPAWDLLFGTCYFPRREPVKFGVNGDPVPGTLVGQMAYPFRAAAAGPGDAT